MAPQMLSTQYHVWLLHAEQVLPRFQLTDKGLFSSVLPEHQGIGSPAATELAWQVSSAGGAAPQGGVQR